MGFSGMNAAIIERVARDLNTQSNRIETVMGTVDSIVTRTQQAWAGQDARRFETDWRGDRTSLKTLATAMDNLATKARAEAREQRQTSGG